MNHHLPHMIYDAAKDNEHPKFAGVMLILIGLFLTPWLIGLPILLLGIYKVCK